eukprot:g4918.t1
MAENCLFCTVGTTSFDELIGTLTSRASLAALADLGMARVVLQTGRGEVTGPTPEARDATMPDGLLLATYAFKPSLDADMREADWIISHAGAGSIMEALRRRKRLIVVVNEALMDNHQTELAEALGDEGYLKYATCSTVMSVLSAAVQDGWAPKDYPEADLTIFPQLLDDEIFGGLKHE